MPDSNNDRYTLRRQRQASSGILVFSNPSVSSLASFIFAAIALRRMEVDDPEFKLAPGRIVSGAAAHPRGQNRLE